MKNNKPVLIPVRSATEIPWCILEAKKAARTLEFEEHAQQMIATAISELAYNIIKYAGKGRISISQVTHNKRYGIEIVARDRGPGIDNMEQALADHFSSGGTLGLGLPGIKRMMDEFKIESEVGKGTIVTIRKWR